MPTDDCIFCQIVAGASPVSVVYRDDLVIAFMDTRPVNPGHLLVIPLVHATYLADLDEQVGMRMFAVAQRISQAVRDSSVRSEGINLHLADGVAAGQEVFHVHLHVIPRFDGDPAIFTANWGAPPGRTELDAVAQDVRKGVTEV
ncbi:MAG: HIT family protein [SAR202 cluster bacterium]|jgi:diadenosine tetraphosphate (Ap4A) HIT family hydrolase|nr:HIT family protein [SAR202 cluster bacterium]MDP6513016.1 HIT family protein [SAR202 cluster bacterium]MDP6714662.1 HIT family protein [SAR202 cluster bacterium]